MTETRIPLLITQRLSRADVRAKLLDIVNSLDEPYREICKSKMGIQFFHLPASLSKHHVWEGGLAQHTLELMVIGDNTCSLTPRLNRNIILTSCFFHDIGKIKDLDGDEITGFRRTDHYDKIYHITRSYHEWMQASEHYTKVDKSEPNWEEVKIIPEQVREHIAHCILAHHGSPEFKSPVSPQTPEAWAVHLADMTSVFVFHDKKVKKSN